MIKLFFTLTLLIMLPVLASGQLSPGDLSNFHKDLEGLKNCTKCHEVGNQLTGKKCLACHTVLKDRIDKKVGLHSNPRYQNCNSCHVEHQGRNYQLVYWKGGKENFEHKLTGYRLEGKHSRVKCEQCHLPDNIQDQQKLIAGKVDVNRTYLGLQRDCLNCHEDEHRGQLDRTCLTCHTMEGWRPASKFNHAQTRFPLTGKHQVVKCEKCHPKMIDHKYQDNPDFLQFTHLNKNKCNSCHEDAHHNQFGQNCERCHSTKNWHSVDNENFNHDLTRYPLRGKHKALKCNLCHFPGKQMRGLAHEKCQDCHQDFHRGQFTHRQEKGACEECHTVNGFKPSQFTIVDHARTDYPLKGSHLAVPCNACHKEDKRRKTISFRFTSTKCNTCHPDPHRGQVDNYKQLNGCEYCHFEKSWDFIDFDHSKTKFALQGKHQTIKCRACHKKIDLGGGKEQIQILGLDKNCATCHEDIHADQFRVTKNEVVHCEKCHSPMNWKAEKFVHNRDSNFKLDGAHEKVECSKCHKSVTINGKTVTLYKPIGKQCKSCHGENVKFNIKI